MSVAREEYLERIATRRLLRDMVNLCREALDMDMPDDLRDRINKKLKWYDDRQLNHGGWLA